MVPDHAMTLFQVIDANRAYLQPWFQWVDQTCTPSDTERFIKAAWSGYKKEQEVLNRIEARCAVHNERSRSVMERLGMRHEGTLREGERLPGGYADQLIYGMLAKEWQRREGKL